MTRAVLSLGSNLGDRLATCARPSPGLGDVLLVVSGVYETPPWGDADQPAYLNAVVLVADAGADARRLAGAGPRAARRPAGRVRDPERRFGPAHPRRRRDRGLGRRRASRCCSDDPELTLPHPRAHLRAFVLRPWIDIEPYGRLPGHGWLTDLLNAEPVAGDALELQSPAGSGVRVGRMTQWSRPA